MLTLPTCQFLPVVYPVGGLTDLQPFFTRKIDYNSVTLDRGTELHFHQPFTCTKFQLDRSMHSQFMAENAKYAIRRRKLLFKVIFFLTKQSETRRTMKRRNYFKTLLRSLVSRDWLARLPQILYVDSKASLQHLFIYLLNFISLWCKHAPKICW